MVCTETSLHIGSPAGIEFAFQTYIHYQLLVVLADLHAGGLLLFCLTTKNLNLIDHVGGQVLQGYGRVSLEEVLAVDQQRLHEFAVHVYLVIPYLRSWQLPNQSVKH